MYIHIHRGISSALPASRKRIGYIIVRTRIDGRRGRSEPPELSLTGCTATAEAPTSIRIPFLVLSLSLSYNLKDSKDLFNLFLQLNSVTVPLARSTDGFLPSYASCAIFYYVRQNFDLPLIIFPMNFDNGTFKVIAYAFLKDRSNKSAMRAPPNLARAISTMLIELGRKEIDAVQSEHLGRSCLSIVPRSRSHARLRRNVTMSHAFSCVQPVFNL
ncbi:hypothetical protein EVAR_83420_1 [Eumeta japonica]|uniref:Uncharacterized protein n=1 Tax=Eumeta variegata TaxID=151549 RepID=A0A4C1TYL3_EUMVA|nr:hypothetical protein EVAR_83420_1 [Eumeta japonica]